MIARIIILILFCSTQAFTQEDALWQKVLSIDSSEVNASERELIYSDADSEIANYESKADENSALKYLEILYRTSSDKGDIDRSLGYGVRVAEKYCLAGLNDDALSILNDIRDKTELNTAQEIKLFKASSDVYINVSDWEAAVRYLDLALSKYEKSEFEKRIITLQNKADIYNQFSQYDRSLEVYDEITELLITYKNFENEYRILNNIGFIHYQQGSVEEAIKYFTEAVKKAKSLNVSDLPDVQYNLAIALKSASKNSESVKVLKKIKKSIARTDSIYPYVGIQLARNYLDLDNLFKADVHIQDLINWASESNRPDILQTAYLQAALLQGEENDFQNALNFYSRHLSIRDSLDNISSQKLNAMSEIKKELQLTKSEIEYL